MAFLIIFMDIIYSALTDNIATIGYFFKDQVTKPPINL